MIASVNVFAFSMNTLCFKQLYCRAIITENISGIFWVCPISFKSHLSQTAWQVAVVAATYYASAEDMLTMGFF